MSMLPHVNHICKKGYLILYVFLTYLINKLQKLQNCAARDVTNTHKYDHISPVLKDLHWLPVKSHIDYKIGLLTYKCLTNQAPSYLKQLVVPYRPGPTLRSSSSNILVMPTVYKGRHQIILYGAANVWNSLPQDVKSAKNYSDLKILLKTHYFRKAYEC